MSKNPWTRERLESYFGLEEGYELEFKSSEPLLGGKAEAYFNDLSAAVSAFLNAEGGLLIIGLEQAPNRDKKRGGVAERLSAGVPRSAWNGDRLQSKLCDRVHPSVASYVRVHTVKVGTASDEDLLAFVVEVRQGNTAYQAGDKLYYCRRSFSSEPMEDKDIRLRMLADDRPRAEILLKVRALDGGRSWAALDQEIEKYEALRARLPRQKNVGAAPADLTEAETVAVEEALYARPRSPHSLRVVVSASLRNTGLVTIHKGAIAWRLDGADKLAPVVADYEYADGTMFFAPSDENWTPLYPEMEGDLKSWGFDVPRRASMDDVKAALDLVVYMDGGLAVRRRVSLGQEFDDPLKQVEDRLSALARRLNLGADW